MNAPFGTATMALDPRDVDRAVRAALDEDLPAGDVTSAALIPAGAKSEAVLLAKESGILAGLPVARRVFEMVDPGVAFEALSEDGRSFQAGDVLGRARGGARSLLAAERTALNFLQRLSGVATLTRAYVRAVAGTKAKILDTRKTTPGLRALEKYSVAAGGGVNHRRSLSDMILIKDNHVRQVGGVLEALRRARAAAPAGLRIEVEITNAAEAEAALRGGADLIMLDNMSVGEMTAVVALAAGRIPLEASGGMTLERVGEVAATGVDFISVGALTHSARAVDISLEFVV